MTKSEDTLTKIHLIHEILTYLIDNGIIHTGFLCIQLEENETPEVFQKNNIIARRLGKEDCNCFNELVLEFLQRYITNINVIDMRKLPLEQMMKDMKES